MASAEADSLALALPTDEATLTLPLALADADEELFLLQIEVADLQSQLDIIQARIATLTEQLEIQPVLLSAPTNEDAFKLWEAAGLQDGMQLEDGLRTLEQWIFSQPNWQQMTREGWIQFVYTIFGESLDKLLGVAH